MWEAINSFLTTVDNLVWGVPLMVLIMAGGILLTARLGLLQMRRLPLALKWMFKNEEEGDGEISSFAALCTALSATIGTGNIVGVATAVCAGGPGALFWMEIAAFFGMATIYAEATLAQEYKVVKHGEVTGGPVYYIHAAFKGTFGKVLGGLFSVFIILALGFMGNMVQSNSISDAFYTAFSVPKWVMGVIVAVLAAFIFIGGISRIASFTEKVVPVMAALYLVGALVVILINIQHVPSAIASIFICAFRPDAVFGAAAGITVRKAMRYGVARGLFSNEAGMGSTPHAHAIADVENPEDQGEVAMIGVFIDTFVVLTMTALVILSSGVLEEMMSTGVKGTPVAQAAFRTGLKGFGPAFVAICLLFFAFSTIVGWYFFARQNVQYLFGKKAVVPFSLIVVVFVFLGSLLKVDLVWNLSDLFNGLMVIPNLMALIVLAGTVAKAAKGEKVEF